MKTPTAPIEVTSGGAMVSLLGEQAYFCPQPGSQLLMTETGTHLGNQEKKNNKPHSLTTHHCHSY